MNSDPLTTVVSSDESLRFSLRRCRCHACRQRRTAELRRALQAKFGQCRSPRPVVLSIDAWATASRRERISYGCIPETQQSARLFTEKSRDPRTTVEHGNRESALEATAAR